MLLIIVQKLSGRHGILYQIVTLSENFYLLSALLIFFLWFLSFFPIFLINERNKLQYNAYLTSSLQDPRFNSWALASTFAAAPMAIELALDWKYLRLSEWNSGCKTWLKRFFMVSTIIVPNIVEYFLLLYYAKNSTTPLIVCIITKAQALSIMGSVLSSLFGKSLEHIGDFVNDKFIEIHTVSALSYFVIALVVDIVKLNYEYQSSMRLNLQTLGLVLNFIGGAEIVYLAGMAYYTQQKLLINGRYHCPHCLSAAIQIKAVFIFSCAQFALFIASSSAEISSSNVCPLWYLLSTRMLQILLSFTLGLLPNRVYKFSAQLKKEALESRLNLLGYLSHEMRSPLNTAFLGLGSINDEVSKIGERLADWHGKKTPVDPSPSSPNTEVVSTELIDSILTTSHYVLESCRVASSTLDDLLTADKIGDGKLLVNTAMMDPWGLFRSCIGPFSITAREKNISFAVTSADPSLSCLLADDKTSVGGSSSGRSEYCVEADEFKISQVIRNLLSNALKFTPSDGQVSMNVEVAMVSPEQSAVRALSTRKFDRIVRLSVTDSGPGIAPEDQKLLFGKYVQFNAGALQKGKGSGLGLWISKSESCNIDTCFANIMTIRIPNSLLAIMELHGGTLTATSEGLGKGSTFTLELPLFAKQQQQEEEEEGTKTAHSSFTDIEVGSSEVSIALSKVKTINVTGIGSSVQRALFHAMSAFRRSSIVFPILSAADENLNRVAFSDLVTVPVLDSLEILPLISEISTPVTSPPPSLIEMERVQLQRLGLAAKRSSFIKPLLLDDARQLTASWEKGLRILLVDDSLPNRKVLKKLLTSHGHAVTEAVDGVDFLKCLGYSLDHAAQLLVSNDHHHVASNLISGGKKNKSRTTASAAVLQPQRGSDEVSNFFDVILIDDNMPRLDGSDAVKLLRGVGYSGLILGITGDADPASMQMFRAKGADEVISKPIDLEQLKKRIATLLSRNR